MSGCFSTVFRRVISLGRIMISKIARKIFKKKSIEKLDIMALPQDTLLRIFNRMNRKSLCRLRRSSKRIDSTVQERRNCVKADRGQPVSFGIVFNIAGFKGFRVVKQKSTVASLFASDDEQSDDDYDFYDDYKKEQENTKVIRFPQKELAGVAIDTVYIKCNSNPIVSISKHTNSHVKPVLKEMNISCNRVILENNLFANTREVVDILSLINYEIVVAGVDELEDILNPPFNHCLNAVITPKNFPSHISQVLKDVIMPKLVLILSDQFVDVFKQFLKDVKKDRKMRGCVEQLTFLDFKDEFETREIPTVEGLELLWKGELPFDVYLSPEERVKQIYRLTVDGGVAVIINQSYIHITIFLEDTGREALFLAVAPYIFAYIPYDVSSLFKEFMETETLPEAFANITKPSDYVYPFKASFWMGVFIGE